MASQFARKNKLLYIIDYLSEYSDIDHKVTMTDIIDMLDKNGIKAERKSIYTDIKALKDFGFDIVGKQQNRMYYYYLASRVFSNDELKILVNALRDLPDIDNDKKDSMIKRLAGFASVHQKEDII